MKQTEPLTIAEQRHLQELNLRLLAAKEEMERFIEFLRDQHGLDSRWTISDIATGFEWGNDNAPNSLQ